MRTISNLNTVTNSIATLENKRVYASYHEEKTWEVVADYRYKGQILPHWKASLTPYAT